MISFEQELMSSRGFTLIPLDGLSAVILANPRLLLPSKSVRTYVFYMLGTYVAILCNWLIL